MSKELDEIDKAEALLAGANQGVTESAESTALATMAIGQLLLYFAKDQRDATQKFEKVMQARIDAELKRISDFLAPGKD